MGRAGRKQSEGERGEACGDEELPDLALEMQHEALLFFVLISFILTDGLANVRRSVRGFSC